MSTLSEIAANHAKAIKTLDAESAMLKALCSPTPPAGEASSDKAQQVPPHTISAINNSISAHAMSI
ncbi:hypothetical protein K3169_13455 [Pseudomonas phytophila]|uniref:Uncharacterized protein n=1 Tax=Pseudomonas phytophila TaxID=2867264 RepID=A0ABY6FLM4_9PSED|nr:hypothetical protein [Pseudomonas phytophila]MCQ2993996.1 hypothetical protein [Pseudomonas syringae]MCQ3029508.1 hypothetical protein [Pseudomonas syringae]UXZ98795.1 hypothetical protein K3169_13455 [Pseudomonas phytophila]